MRVIVARPASNRKAEQDLDRLVGRDARRRLPLELQGALVQRGGDDDQLARRRSIVVADAVG
jgi:hypothetical protein